MSEFQYILTAAQLTKHYEVIQFLTQHPNQEYTLAQLDTLLPHGVAVQRFPEEWFDLVEGGACWHRSIELRRPASSSPSTSPAPQEASSKHEESSVQSRAVPRATYVLSCVKTEVRTLDELRTRLESPSTLLDVDGCVALHTDQLIIAPALLLRAQRTGLAYYFPDAYDRNVFRQFGVRDSTAGSPSGADGASGSISGSNPRASVGQATAALLDSFLHQEENSKRKGSGGGSGGTGAVGGGLRDRTYVVLPPGVRVRHQLLTRRGVPEQEDHCLPTKLYVGERLRLLFDNQVAVKKLNAKEDLRVQFSMAGVKPTNKGEGGAERTDVLSTDPPPPLRILGPQSVKHAATSATAAPTLSPVPSGTPANNNNDSNTSTAATPAAMRPPAPLLASMTTKFEIEALYGCTLTLLLTVNGVENVLAVEVMEETTTMPGVLILRDRQLDNFALPQKDMLMDPLVNPPLESHYPFEVILPTAASATADGAGDALQRGSLSELVPLPWTQNPSPVVLSLREVTYPTQHTTVQAATRAVFSAQSLADEARLRQTKERARREAERQAGAASGGKRRRARYRGNMFLSNRHLLHFGLDFSIPFTQQPN